MKANSLLLVAVFILLNTGFAEKPDELPSESLAEEKGALMNLNAPDFDLEDIHGQRVQLSALRGKVVVLDFWATWCLPCIKSFPAFKMTMEKHKNDKDVVFLFINTWERAQNPKQLAKDFMEKRNLDFRVLIDVKMPRQNLFQVADSYGVTGIPATFIIDKSGVIRNRVSGFSGAEQEVVGELSKMIESAKGL